MSHNSDRDRERAIAQEDGFGQQASLAIILFVCVLHSVALSLSLSISLCLDCVSLVSLGLSRLIWLACHFCDIIRPHLLINMARF